MPFDPDLAALIQERLTAGEALSGAGHLTPYEQRQFRQQLWSAIDAHERGHVSTEDTRVRLAALRVRVEENAAAPRPSAAAEHAKSA